MQSLIGPRNSVYDVDEHLEWAAVVRECAAIRSLVRLEIAPGFVLAQSSFTGSGGAIEAPPCFAACAMSA